jgi:hypothetical protein
VFPPKFGWASFVVPEDSTAAVIRANAGLLLEYRFASDHECVVEIYDRTRRIGGLRCGFEGGRRPRFDRAIFLARGLLAERGAEEIAAYLKAGSHRDDAILQDQYVIAQNLRLPRYRWFSYAYEQDRDASDSERIEIAMPAQ